ncbi:hypothetical protein [Haloferula sp.]|uniref:hypothetical protein n=1 Tax=Haloferula sp. TaxID=2497595 RepID=UPI003C775818
MKFRNTTTICILAIAGAAVWTYSGSRLEQSGAFNFEPNPLGIKRSPYGQVIAMAIQGRIDDDWHGTLESGGPADGDTASSCGHSHCEEPCGSSEKVAHAKPDLIDRITAIATKRTNPNPKTPAHKFYLRREIEKKLRFAYELDPSHYGNYNSYHLFLTHDSLGTSGDGYEKGSQRANALSEATIRYCLRETNDPRPALTAATAAHNILQYMLMDPEQRYTPEQMHQQLTVVDFCLRRHFELLEEASKNGTWDLLSKLRQQEVLDRSTFTMKIRESAEKAIIRIDNETLHQAASSEKS